MSVTLIASDGVELKVDFEIIKQSKIVAGMLENLQQDNPTDLNDEQIPITNVTSAILKRIIEWCTKHKDDKVDDEDDNEKEKNDQEVPKWDSEFLKVDQGTLFEIILAANYLDIPKLLDYTCMVVAGQIRGKSPEEIRKHFNIKNDFTDEEMERIKKENEWCEGN